MDWRARLQREALVADFGDFDLHYHVTLRPAMPPEHAVDNLVALTFRLRGLPDEPRHYVTSIDVAAAMRLGSRMGLDEGGSLAMVDSHERVHVALQLEGAHEALEEGQANVVDAVWLSLRREALAKHLEVGAMVVTRVEPGFWEAAVEPGVQR